MTIGPGIIIDIPIDLSTDEMSGYLLLLDLTTRFFI